MKKTGARRKGDSEKLAELEADKAVFSETKDDIKNSGPKWFSNLEAGLVIKEKEMLTSCQKVDP